MAGFNRDIHDDFMGLDVETEAARIGRNLKWEEAIQIANDYMRLHVIPHEEWEAHDWVQRTHLPVSAFHVEVDSSLGIAWENYETTQDAEEAVQAYQAASGRTFPYTITFCE